ncbi:hypothetical protein JAAARDRAFT_131057 [Jaapia argillacea MUCL 33604]|uniref:Uncharacterized protein n=1 Tax=Jaapia argillacea MUCL 33604 TaxID=933084 RepID=A0A067PQ87_9AGAM|nr:hypothetical protein JAAARDRAFT_131057 [Jaapia argillacea MUCL 33604]
MTYLFLPLGFNSMVLVPDVDEPQGPEYHISISMNCFNPSSFITTLREGCNEDGRYVGDFEMGGLQKTTTVCMGATAYPMPKVLNSNVFSSRSHDWSFDSTQLHWDCVFVEVKRVRRFCYRSRLDRHTILAEFRPPRVRKGGNLKPGLPAQLVLNPAGRPLFHHILMSALIIERVRLQVDPRG